VRPSPRFVVESRGFTLDASKVHEAWMDDAASAAPRDLLARVTVSAEASTTNARVRGRSLACDGSEETAGAARRTTPIRGSFCSSTRRACGPRSLLGHLNGKEANRDAHDRARKVSIKVPSLKEPIVAELGDDELEPAVVALPARSRSACSRSTVLERVPGKRWKGNVGFADVALESARAAVNNRGLTPIIHRRRT
jgi:hypothetical protein